jgi:hypothetical protein
MTGLLTRVRPSSPPVSTPSYAPRRCPWAPSAGATREAWDAFLARHPTGYYADLARVQRGRLAVVMPPMPPTPPPDPVKPVVGLSGVNPLSPERERAPQVEGHVQGVR